MIRFGAQGAYIIYFGAPREDAYSGQGAYFFFEKNRKLKKKHFNIYLKTNNIWNCNSDKYWRWMFS